MAIASGQSFLPDVSAMEGTGTCPKTAGSNPLRSGPSIWENRNFRPDPGAPVIPETPQCNAGWPECSPRRGSRFVPKTPCLEKCGSERVYDRGNDE